MSKRAASQGKRKVGRPRNRDAAKAACLGLLSGLYAEVSDAQEHCFPLKPGFQWAGRVPTEKFENLITYKRFRVEIFEELLKLPDHQKVGKIHRLLWSRRQYQFRHDIIRDADKRQQNVLVRRLASRSDSPRLENAASRTAAQELRAAMEHLDSGRIDRLHHADIDKG